MLKRPSSRRRSKGEGINLNLVPILDTMVALISFLLFTTSFLAIVHIESPVPQTSAAVNEKKIQEKPLQLTVSLREKEAEIWSPFDRIPSKIIPNPTPGQPDVKTLHDSLLAIKQQFPKETQVVFVPFSGATYDVLVSVMDSMRMVEKTDTPIYQNDDQGVSKPVKQLFPDVIFGNLLEGG